MIHAQNKMEHLTEMMGAARMVSLLKRSEEELADYRYRITRTLRQQDWVNAEKLTRRMMNSLLIIGDSALENVLDNILNNTYQNDDQSSFISEFTAQLNIAIRSIQFQIDQLYRIEV